MQLAEVVQGLILGAVPTMPAKIEVRGICHDSRRCEPGDLFVAISGQRFDGRLYAGEAAQRGAVVVVGQGEAPPDLDIPWLQAAADPRTLLGPLASRVYRSPQEEMTVFGVTGTNGKSTSVALMAAVLDAAGQPAGVIGTLGYRFGDLALPSERTTPEASDLFRILRTMRDRGARAVAMEVSSHALSLDRVSSLRFDVALFTNLTRDHLDYHASEEEYFLAKRRLFDLLKPSGKAVVNLDDPFGRRLARELPQALLFSTEESMKSEAHVRIVRTELNDRGIRGQVVTPSGSYDFRSRLVGRFNVSNLAAVAASAEALGLPHEAVRQAFLAQRPIPGRLERVRPASPLQAFVDYAHTPAALEAALRSVRELTRGRVVLVFGCGGDRDAGKRSQMGQIAGQLADLPIATSDNPRSEDPQKILAEVEKGLRQSGNPQYRVVPDRREAIRRAIAVAPTDSVVLVAGKGHEEVQIVDGETRPFSDRREIELALEKRFGRKTTG